MVYRFPGRPPSLPDCLIYWNKAVDKVSNNPSNFIGVGCDLSLSIHNFITLGPFSILLDKSCQWFANSIVSLKEPTSSPVDLFY